MTSSSQPGPSEWAVFYLVGLGFTLWLAWRRQEWVLDALFRASPMLLASAMVAWPLVLAAVLALELKAVFVTDLRHLRSEGSAVAVSTIGSTQTLFQQARRLAVFIAAVVVVVPPWHATVSVESLRTGWSLGHSPLWAPPSAIDSSAISIQYGRVAAVTIDSERAAYFLTSRHDAA